MKIICKLISFLLICVHCTAAPALWGVRGAGCVCVYVCKYWLNSVSSRIFWFIVDLNVFAGSVGSTNMNMHSSRSHAIFTVTVECSEKGADGEQHVRVGKLHLVDLAVSNEYSGTLLTLLLPESLYCRF